MGGRIARSALIGKYLFLYLARTCGGQVDFYDSRHLLDPPRSGEDLRAGERV